MKDEGIHDDDSSKDETKDVVIKMGLNSLRGFVLGNSIWYHTNAIWKNTMLLT